MRPPMTNPKSKRLRILMLSFDHVAAILAGEQRIANLPEDATVVCSFGADYNRRSIAVWIHSDSFGEVEHGHELPMLFAEVEPTTTDYTFTIGSCSIMIRVLRELLLKTVASKEVLAEILADAVEVLGDHVVQDYAELLAAARAVANGRSVMDLEELMPRLNAAIAAIDRRTNGIPS